MKKIFFIMPFVVLCFVKGIAVENRAPMIRMDLNPQMVVLCDEKFVLMTNTFGPVILNNLQYDKKGYYTICPVFYCCDHCDKCFDSCPLFCDCCGFPMLHITVKEPPSEREYLTSQGLLKILLNDPSLLQCGEFFIKTELNDENLSLSRMITSCSNPINASDLIIPCKHTHHHKDNDSHHEKERDSHDKNKDTNRNQKTHEAQEHYDNAKEACIEGLAHSAAAGAIIEIPPLAIYEGYQAIEAWKTMGDEYCKGVECEENSQENRENHNNQGGSND